MEQEPEILVTDSNGGSSTQSFQLTISDVEPGTISGSVYLDPTFRRALSILNSFLGSEALHS
ncbi:MAG: hypothetical protein HC921_20540 [Synechococcaceae cyanobacterium SM2_3_1]|nr:hypothetical protein [Synechococcaceae cyanobacterium SM2_3_1]